MGNENPKKAHLKESNKYLILMFDNVRKMHKAWELLQLTWDGVKHRDKVQTKKNPHQLLSICAD